MNTKTVSVSFVAYEINVCLIEVGIIPKFHNSVHLNSGEISVIRQIVENTIAFSVITIQVLKIDFSAFQHAEHFCVLHLWAFLPCLALNLKPLFTNKF